MHCAADNIDELAQCVNTGLVLVICQEAYMVVMFVCAHFIVFIIKCMDWVHSGNIVYTYDVHINYTQLLLYIILYACQGVSFSL